MQPYLYPYPLYYRMAIACDTFVVLDNVGYRKGSFINRNRIGSLENPVWFRRPVARVSQNRTINNHKYLDYEESTWRLLAQLYSGCDNFEPVERLLRSNSGLTESTVSVVNANSISSTLTWLGFDTHFVFSSEISLEPTLIGSDRVLALCELLGANCYINLPGGRSLYDRDAFAKRGIDLCFIQAPEVEEGGLSVELGSLSIIHSLMLLGRDNLRKKLMVPSHLASQ